LWRGKFIVIAALKVGEISEEPRGRDSMKIHKDLLEEWSRVVGKQ
jgi:hypothetical protein